MTSQMQRGLSLAAGLYALALIGVALYMQHVEGLDPCPLCILQRYGYLATGVLLLVAGAFPAGAGRRATLGLAALAALAGAAVAARHVWILYHPAASCGFDPVESFVNGLPPADWLPSVFAASGLCTAELPPLLGLQIPEWSLIWLVVLAVFSAWLALTRAD